MAGVRLNTGKLIGFFLCSYFTLFSVRGQRVSSFFSRETLLELRSELGSYILPVTTVAFSEIQTHGIVT